MSKKNLGALILRLLSIFTLLCLLFASLLYVQAENEMKDVIEIQPVYLNQIFNSEEDVDAEINMQKEIHRNALTQQGLPESEINITMDSYEEKREMYKEVFRTGQALPGSGEQQVTATFGSDNTGYEEVVLTVEEQPTSVDTNNISISNIATKAVILATITVIIISTILYFIYKTQAN